MKNRGSIQPRASYTTKHRFLIRWKETYDTELNIPHQICFFHAQSLSKSCVMQFDQPNYVGLYLQKYKQEFS